MDINEEIGLLHRTLESLAGRVEALRGMLSRVSTNVRSVEQPAMHGRFEFITSYLALAPRMQEDELLNTLLTCAMSVVRAEGAAVTIYDPQEKMLVFRAAVGIAADRLLNIRVSLKTSQHGIAFMTRQVVSSTPMDKTVDSITGEHYRNVLAAPLIINGEPIGTLGAVNKIGEEHFTVQDLQDYSNFADLAAHIIQQRRRETDLKNALEGKTGTIPAELSGLTLSRDEVDFLQISEKLASIGRRAPQMLSLCKQLVNMIADFSQERPAEDFTFSISDDTDKITF